MLSSSQIAFQAESSELTLCILSWSICVQHRRTFLELFSYSDVSLPPPAFCFSGPKGSRLSSFPGAGSKAQEASLATLCYTMVVPWVTSVLLEAKYCVSSLSANIHWPTGPGCWSVCLWDLVHLSLPQMALPCLSTLAALVIFCPGAQPDHSVKLQHFISRHSEVFLYSLCYNFSHCCR